MIIGVAKAGTTALFRHLAQSPLVFAHKAQEMTYFSSDYEFGRGWKEAVDKYFSDYRDEVLLAKNVMNSYSRLALERLKAQCPDVKCIMILRDPAERAYSEFHHARLRGIEDCDKFEDALGRESERAMADPEFWATALYLRNSSYAEPLKNALEIFGSDNLLVLSHADYRTDAHKQLEKVEAFLGRPLFSGIDVNTRDHNRAAKARYPWLSKHLYRFFKSKGLVRRTLRIIMPHRMAVFLRMAIERYNRLETDYPPLNEDTARHIHGLLKSDKDEVIRLLGYCPW